MKDIDWKKIDKLFMRSPYDGLHDDDENKRIFYALTVENMSRKYNYSNEVILMAIARNMEVIIKRADRLDMFFDDFWKLFEDETLSDEFKENILKQIDEIIAQNFDEFINTCDIDNRATFDYFRDFKGMPKTQQKIKEYGPEITKRIRFSSLLSNEEIKERFEHFFGSMDNKYLGILKFGFLGREKAEQVSMIVESLFKYSNCEGTINDIVKLDSGLSTTAYKVGDYVIKLGANRNFYERKRTSKSDIIPNCPYILQPIIRQPFDYRYTRKVDSPDTKLYTTDEMTRESYYAEMTQDEMYSLYQKLREHLLGYGLYGTEKTKEQIDKGVLMEMAEKLQTYYFRDGFKIENEGRREGYYIEVQNYVDTKWTEGLSEIEITEICFRLQMKLLDYDLYTNDAKAANIGKLLKPNRANMPFQDFEIDENGEIHFVERDLRPTQEGMRMKGEVSESEVVGVGEYVLLDTEQVFKITSPEQKQEIMERIEYNRRKAIELIKQEQKESEERGEL